jgi:hypothetical protein
MVGGDLVTSPAQYAQMTSISPAVSYSPGTPAPLPVGSLVVSVPTYFQASRGGEVSALTTCAARITGDGWQCVAYGLVLRELSMTLEEGSRAVRVSLTCEASWVEYVSPPGTPAKPVYPDGQMLHALSAPLTITAASAGSPAPPAEIPRIASPCVDEVSVSLAWTLEYPGCGSSWVGRARPEAVDLDVTADLLLSTATDTELLEWSEQWRDSTARCLMIGFSAAGSDAEGEGGCVYIPRAMLKEEPRKPSLDKDFLRTRLVFGAGRWDGTEEPGAAPGTPATLSPLVQIGIG